MKIKRLWAYIAASDKGLFIRGKKAIFLLGFLTAISFFWKTNHNGDPIDRAWSSLPIWGTTTVVIVTLFLFYVANKKIDKDGFDSY